MVWVKSVTKDELVKVGEGSRGTGGGPILLRRVDDEGARRRDEEDAGDDVVSTRGVIRDAKGSREGEPPRRLAVETLGPYQLVRGSREPGKIGRSMTAKASCPVRRRTISTGSN